MRTLAGRLSKLEETARPGRKPYIVDERKEGPDVDEALARRGITERPIDLVVVIRDIDRE